MLLYQSRILNARFVVQYDDQIVANGATEEGALTDHSHAFHQRKVHRVAIDSQGRGRFEMTGGTYDATDKYVPTGEKEIILWDLDNCIDYVESSGKQPEAAIGTKRPFEISKRFRRPLRQFGGNFITALSDAVDRGTRIKIVQLNTGQYELSFERNNGTQVGIVDPNQGFAVVTQEYHRKGVLRYRYTAQFREVEDGIWFPVSGRAIRYANNLSEPKISRTAVTIKQIKVNDPKFDASLFHMDFPKGTRVVDARSGVEYIVGDANSLKIYGPSSEPIGVLLDESLSNLGSTIDGALRTSESPLRKRSNQQPATQTATPSGPLHSNPHDYNYLVFIIGSAVSGIVVVVIIREAVRRRRKQGHTGKD